MSSPGRLAAVTLRSWKEAGPQQVSRKVPNTGLLALPLPVLLARAPPQPQLPPPHPPGVSSLLPGLPLGAELALQPTHLLHGTCCSLSLEHTLRPLQPGGPEYWEGRPCPWQKWPLPCPLRRGVSPQPVLSPRSPCCWPSLCWVSGVGLEGWTPPEPSLPSFRALRESRGSGLGGQRNWEWGPEAPATPAL